MFGGGFQGGADSGLFFGGRLSHIRHKGAGMGSDLFRLTGIIRHDGSCARRGHHIGAEGGGDSVGDHMDQGSPERKRPGQAQDPVGQLFLFV